MDVRPPLNQSNQTGGHGGNNHGHVHGRGCGGIPFNLENTPPPVEENISPPPPPNLVEVMAQQTQLLAALVEGANHH